MRQRVSTFEKPLLVTGGVSLWPGGASTPPPPSTLTATAHPAGGNDDGVSSIGSWPSLRRARNRIVAQVAVANGEPRSLITARASSAAPPAAVGDQPSIYDTSQGVGGSSWREREAERLANWTRQALSCESIDDAAVHPAAAASAAPAPLPLTSRQLPAPSPPPPPPPASLAWSANALAKRIRSEQLMNEMIVGGDDSRHIATDPRLASLGHTTSGGGRFTSAPHTEPPSPKSQNSLKFATLVRRIQRNK